MTSQRDLTSNRNPVYFACLLLLFCVWALSLPLFPTQDGPMHKYYVHAMASLLSGSHEYHAYAVRHPLPPYVTHYALLLGLTRFVSFDLAEKILICIIFFSTAYGFRYCARSLGPSGDVLSLCMVPLVLHWSLVMGFLNYSLAIALFFLAAGLWYRAAGGDSRLWLAFAGASLLLSFTHPIPLLLLIVFCVFDLLLRMGQDYLRSREKRGGAGEGSANFRASHPSQKHEGWGTHFSLKNYRWQLCGVGFTVLCFLYPLASVDRSRSTSNLRGFGFHPDALLSSLALFGISPFDTRSKNLLINGYRVALIVLLAGCLAVAATGFARRWQSRELRTSDSMGLLALAMLVAIPILPPAMNGSDFFSQRLMIFPWLCAIAAASGDARPQQQSRWVGVFAVFFSLSVLLPAEFFFRPVARQLFVLEHQALPEHTQGLGLLDPAMLKAVRVEHQLGFNPYLWSGALPMLHADDIMLNSPFMDQKITPLMPAPGGDLLIDQMASAEQAERLINGNVDLPALPPEIRGALLASTRVVVFVGTPFSLRQGLVPLIGPVSAAQFKCSNYAWYLICQR